MHHPRAAVSAQHVKGMPQTSCLGKEQTCNTAHCSGLTLGFEDRLASSEGRLLQHDHFLGLKPEAQINNGLEGQISSIRGQVAATWPLFRVVRIQGCLGLKPAW